VNKYGAPANYKPRYEKDDIRSFTVLPLAIADGPCNRLIACSINRSYLKPHHLGGWFTHGYLNDVMCLPRFFAEDSLCSAGHRPSLAWRLSAGVRNPATLGDPSVLFELILLTMPKAFARSVECGGVSGGRCYRENLLEG
jgi:hypothetical protein